MKLKVIDEQGYIGVLIVHEESGCELFSHCVSAEDAYELKGKIEGIYGNDYAVMIDIEVNDGAGRKFVSWSNGDEVKICGAGFSLVKAADVSL